MYPKDYFNAAQASDVNSKCFVIMPFSEDYDEIYDTIKEAVEVDSGLICERADDLTGGGHILEDILEGLGSSEVIIADLTGRNPNVFYELGIAHMVKDVAKIIMLTQDPDSIPFDLRIYRSIVYEQSIAGGKKLKKEIIKALKDTTAGVFRFVLKPNTPYKFPHRIYSSDRLIYDFEIPYSDFAFGGAKIGLEVTKHIPGREPKIVLTETIGITEGESRKIPHMGWNLRLEKVDDSTARFMLFKSSS